jgi:YfiH family protein
VIAGAWTGPGGVEACWTGRAEGDMGHHGRYVEEVDAAVEARRRAVVDRPWSWIRQVHGADVTVVAGPGENAGRVADASVSAVPGVALAVLTADCAPIALASPEGVFGAVHAGWKGLRAGVVEEAVAAMSRLGAGEVHAALGPCLHVECCAFSPADLDSVAARLGPAVRGRTSGGAPALDIPAAVASALGRAGARLVAASPACTACSSGYFSHRQRGELERQALIVWR